MNIVLLSSYVEWSPGNGTRYALHFSVLPNGAFGRQGPVILVVGPTYQANRAMLVGAEGVEAIALEKVKSVMSLNEANALPVTIMIAAVLGIEAIIPDSARTDGIPWRDLPPFTFVKEPIL